MTEDRDSGGRRWHDLMEDEQQRFMRVLTTMMALGASGFLAEKRQKEELAERRRISKVADSMLAGVPIKRKRRTR